MKMAPILVSLAFQAKKKLSPGHRPVCPDSQVLAVADAHKLGFYYQSGLAADD